MPRSLFWNVVGTAGLGLCSFVLTLNLSFFPWIVAGELAQGYHSNPRCAHGATGSGGGSG